MLAWILQLPAVADDSCAVMITRRLSEFGEISDTATCWIWFGSVPVVPPKIR
jgi:hypothetical protein